MFIQLFWYAKRLREHLLLVRRTEQELTEARVSIMLSQIQPHFLYNSLTSIKELCDAGEQWNTSKALEHFAYYLRGNMDSLSDTRLISFTKEVSHVKDYLYLEKMRFEDRLTIIWELHVTDFQLPALTLQPIVENAVRHGITEKKDGFAARNGAAAYSSPSQTMAWALIQMPYRWMTALISASPM